MIDKPNKIDPYEYINSSKKLNNFFKKLNSSLKVEYVHDEDYLE